MKDLLINQIAPIFNTAIVAALVIIIKQVGSAAIELFIVKKNESEQKIIASGHEKELNTAKEVWNIVEEKFRITDNAKLILGSKVEEFDSLLLNRIPGLTQSNIEDLRQAVAGEVNKYKDTTMLSTATSIACDSTNSDQLISLQDTNTKLQNENLDLKARIDQINSALNLATITNAEVVQKTV